MPVRALLAAALLAAATPAPATDFAWNTAATGNWAIPENWTPNGVPTTGDNVTIGVAGTYTVNLTGDRAANNVTLSAAGATVSGGFNGSTFTLGGTMLL